MEVSITKVMESPACSMNFLNRTLLMCTAVNDKNKIHQQPKALQVTPENESDQGKKDKQVPAKEYPGEWGK